MASFGFYALTGRSTISFGERTIKETVCEALETIREQNPPNRILLVADNYGSHRAKLTQERADELGIEFVFIPPHSPTLNAIEPLWKSLKREISPEIYDDEDHFQEFLTERFLRLSRQRALRLTGSTRFSQMSKGYADHFDWHLRHAVTRSRQNQDPAWCP